MRRGLKPKKISIYKRDVIELSYLKKYLLTICRMPFLGGAVVDLSNYHGPVRDCPPSRRIISEGDPPLMARSGRFGSGL